MSSNFGRVLGLLLLSVATLLAAWSRLAAAQEPTTPAHHGMGTANVINGRERPEQISDLKAQSLFFLAAASVVKNNTPEELDLQRAMIHVPLTDEQANQIAGVLENFLTQRTAAVAIYNSAASANDKQGKLSTDALKQLRLTEKSLTAETEAKIELILGLPKSQAFHDHLQFQKQRMIVAVEED